MPRHNFIARESFVDATEKQVKDSLLSIPAFAPNIKLVSENRLNESVRFLYEQPSASHPYHIDACILPLNGDFTRISLHGRYVTEEAFRNDTEIALVLADFESALKAALQGDVSLYEPFVAKVANSRRMVQQTMSVLVSVGMLFLKKKLS